MNPEFSLPGQPIEEQLFVIGDVHGQAVALRKTLERIAETPANGQPRHLVFIGDIIDRGPDSLGAADLVLNAKEIAAVDRMTFLPGNHELMMIQSVRAPNSHAAMIWVLPQNGGMQVIEEIDPDGSRIRSNTGLAAVVRDRLGDFISLIESAPNNLWIRDLLLVHAGILPGFDMDEFLDLPKICLDGRGNYDEVHWAWIREPFLSREGGWDEDGKTVIIHGHTPHNEGCRINPQDRGQIHGYFDHVKKKRRICVDAGAARGLDQIALLTISGLDYRLDVIQEHPFCAPVPDWS